MFCSGHASAGPRDFAYHQMVVAKPGHVYFMRLVNGRSAIDARVVQPEGELRYFAETSHAPNIPNRK